MLAHQTLSKIPSMLETKDVNKLMILKVFERLERKAMGKLWNGT